jgi:hypothetical protein
VEDTAPSSTRIVLLSWVQTKAPDVTDVEDGNYLIVNAVDIVDDDGSVSIV